MSWNAGSWNTGARNTGLWDTELTRRLGLRLPVVQGPLGGGLSSVALVGAVADAGGLGSFGVHHLAPQALLDTAAQLRARTSAPFALNLWMPCAYRQQKNIEPEPFANTLALLAPFYDELGLALPEAPPAAWPDEREQMEALLEARPAVFSFVFGIPPADVLRRCRQLGILTLGAATTVAEARALEAAGVDMLVASGAEAGGHRVAFLEPPERGLIGLFALLPQVVDAVRIPVIGAGGIADGRGMAAALLLGAQGVQLGTAFLACEESAASAVQRASLFQPQAGDTVLTRVFSGRLARGIRNEFVERLQAVEHSLPGYPLLNSLTAELKRAAVARQRPELMSLWSGQSAGLLRHRNAGAVLAALEEQAQTLLGRL